MMLVQQCWRFHSTFTATDGKAHSTISTRARQRARANSAKYTTKAMPSSTAKYLDRKARPMNTPLSAYRPHGERPRSAACSARTRAAVDQAAHRIKGVSVAIRALSQLIGASQYSKMAQAARSRLTGDQAHHSAQPTPSGNSTAGMRMAHSASPSTARIAAIHHATMGGWS